MPEPRAENDSPVLRHPWMAKRQLIGMVHVRALPGSPSFGGSMDEVVATALDEARALLAAGFTGILLENMHDRPYLPRDAGHGATAGMAHVAAAVRSAHPEALIGVQILAGANMAALAVAQACGLQFVRAEGFVFAHVADEGLLESDAGELLRYRRLLGAEEVAVLADIKKKHSAHTITADVGLDETAEAARFFLADGVIVTGTATGRAARPEDVRAAARNGGLPVFLGSGVTPENVADYPDAGGFIVGSSLKRDGLWSNSLDNARCSAMVAAFRTIDE